MLIIIFEDHQRICLKCLLDFVGIFFFLLSFEFYVCAKLVFGAGRDKSQPIFIQKQKCDCGTIKRGTGPLHSLVGVEASNCLYHSLFTFTQKDNNSMSTLNTQVMFVSIEMEWKKLKSNKIEIINFFIIMFKNTNKKEKIF